MQDVVLTNLVQEGSALETLRHLCNMHDHTTLRVIVIEAWEQNEVQQVPRVWNHASQAWRLDNESWHPDAMMWSNSDVCPYTYEKHMGFSLCLCFLLNGISFSHALRFRNYVMIFTVWRCTFMGQPAKTTGGVSRQFHYHADTGISNYINVVGPLALSSRQDFSLSWQWDSTEQFTLCKPLVSNFSRAGDFFL